jgi:hypothetical protein
MGATLAEDLGQQLDRLHPLGVLTLHQRCHAGAALPIDHLVVTPNGVWVVAERRVRGTVRFATRRTLAGPLQLLVNGCDRTGWIRELEHQLRDVRRAMAEADLLHVAVHGAVCVTESELPLMQRQLHLDDGIVTWPRALQKLLAATGPVDRELRAQVRATLAQAFPRAVD